jgi:hypothetical protein
MLGYKLEPQNLQVTKNGREASSDDLVGNGDVLLISLSPSLRTDFFVRRIFYVLIIMSSCIMSHLIEIVHRT